MNERGIEDVINTLFEMVQEARGVPLSADKCILEREKVLDLLDEILNQLPGELKQARTIVESRGEVINNAKREAENILRQAQAQARDLVSESEIHNQASQEAESMIQAAREESERTYQTAQDRIRELKQLTNEFVDDALRKVQRHRGRPEPPRGAARPRTRRSRVIQQSNSYFDRRSYEPYGSVPLLAGKRPGLLPGSA